MSYLLVTGIVFTVVPFLLIQGFAFFILLNFVRDDKDANAIFTFAMIALFIGIGMIIGHFVINGIGA